MQFSSLKVKEKTYAHNNQDDFSAPSFVPFLDDDIFPVARALFSRVCAHHVLNTQKAPRVCAILPLHVSVIFFIYTWLING